MEMVMVEVTVMVLSLTTTKQSCSPEDEHAKEDRSIGKLCSLHWWYDQSQDDEKEIQENQ